jgi:hypothetical protein
MPELARRDLLQEGTRIFVLMGWVVFFVVFMLSLRHRGRGS